jgi:hypothetical protein
MSHTARLRVLPAALLLPLVAACGGSDPSTVAAPPSPSASVAAPSDQPTSVASGVASDTAQQIVSLTVSHGKVTGDTGRVHVKLGTRIRITVLSDVADEIHVHLYDLTQEMSAGTPASIEFVADRAGVITVELEHSKLPLTHLQVQ